MSANLTGSHSSILILILAVGGMVLLDIQKADAQIQPYLNARSPFVYDGVASRALIGTEESTLAVAGASIINGWYGEVAWDVEGLLGKENNLNADAPSFLVKFSPFHIPMAPEMSGLITFSLGTKALSSLDAYAGAGIYLREGQFALGGGLDVTWDKLDDERLSGPSYAGIIHGYTRLLPSISVDVAATFSDNSADNVTTDMAVIYQPFKQPFQVYLGLIDVFSGHLERRIGISYAIGY